MKKKAGIKHVVFAGGGSRCLWQAGFWEIAESGLGIRPGIVAGVSAGSAVACMMFSGRLKTGLDYFKRITGLNRSNFYPSRIFGRGPVFPHYDMYRSVILETIEGAAFRKLKKGPEIRILLSRPPGFLGPRSATIVGLLAYTIEKKISYPVHPVMSARLGFKPEVVSIREVDTPQELADLVLASSCTPPFVPILKWNGIVSLDGGLIDNVPIAAIDAGEMDGDVLLMLTRKYPDEKIPKIPGRIYVQPSEPIGITKWDYTSPSGLQDAYDLGRRDGEKFVKSFRGKK